MNNNNNYNKYIILLTLSGYFKFEMKCDAKRKIKYLIHMSKWNYKSKIKTKKKKEKKTNVPWAKNIQIGTNENHKCTAVSIKRLPGFAQFDNDNETMANGNHEISDWHLHLQILPKYSLVLNSPQWFSLSN